ncbi:hypothetical protein PMEGAPL103_44590 [Priestia megaterium]
MVFLADIIKKFHFWETDHSFQEYKLPYTQMKKIRDVARLNNLTGNKSTSIYAVCNATRKILTAVKICSIENLSTTRELMHQK